jgi:surfactin synthase thioesterase subunit
VGFAEPFWKPVREYWQEQNPQTRRRCATGAEIYLFDGGHFLLESHLDEAASTIRRFLTPLVLGPGS